MQIAPEDEASRGLRLAFCRELLRDLDAVQAAIRAGVSESDAPAVAARLTRQASTWQLVEMMSLAARYAHDARYRIHRARSSTTFTTAARKRREASG